ncbi:MAG: IS256 family transposase [Acidobacteriota bacterium]
MTKEQLEQLQKDLAKAKTFEDLMGADGAIRKIMKLSMEHMLQSEMDEHVGYEKHSAAGDNSGNSRNGSSKKTLKTSQGEITIDIPRDRNGEFNPVAVGKHQRTLGDLEDKIISMYAKGMTTRDIQGHIEEIYALKLSPTSISNITDNIIGHIREWQARPLESVYSIVFFDAIYFKVREDSKVVNKAAYTCLAIDLEGHKDMLGIWIGQAESSRFWLSIFNELKNRGVSDILIACVDGLRGFTDAIESAFPQTEVQQCVIHQIRTSLKYVASKNQKEFLADLKPVYAAATEEDALIKLDDLEEKWGAKYPMVINSWRVNWTNLSTYFKYPPEIRKIIYTTNAVEALHRQFRKVTKSKSLFPNDEALTKMLYLAYRDISKKWTMAVQNWALVISQLSIFFKERLTEHL